MLDSALRTAQLDMARYLRDPLRHAPPAGVDQRRLRVHEQLVYNNIEGFLSSGFPVLHSLHDADCWRALVREFIARHRCRTPYFLEISQEFVQFLLEEHQPRAGELPFLAALAHYEWVELALDTADEELPPDEVVDDVLAAVPRLSPLAWSLSYPYPVHRIGPGFPYAGEQQTTYLVVWRDRQQQVRFMETNAATARLLEKVRDNQARTVDVLLAELADEMGMDPASLREFGASQIAGFVAQSIVLLGAR